MDTNNTQWNPIHQTRILPLRWFANICERISYPHLTKSIDLDEDQNYGFRYKYHAKMWSIFFKPYRRWGTYYSLEVDELIDASEKDVEERLKYMEENGI